MNAVNGKSARAFTEDAQAGLAGFALGFPRAEWLSGAPRRRVFKNPKPKIERVYRKRPVDLTGLNDACDKTHERRRGRVVFTPAGVQNRGQALVVIVTVVMMLVMAVPILADLIAMAMEPFVQFGRSCQNKRQ